MPATAIDARRMPLDNAQMNQKLDSILFDIKREEENSKILNNSSQKSRPRSHSDSNQYRSSTLNDIFSYKISRIEKKLEELTSEPSSNTGSGKYSPNHRLALTTQNSTRAPSLSHIDTESPITRSGVLSPVHASTFHEKALNSAPSHKRRKQVLKFVYNAFGGVSGKSTLTKMKVASKDGEVDRLALGVAKSGERRFKAVITSIFGWAAVGAGIGLGVASPATGPAAPGTAALGALVAGAGFFPAINGMKAAHDYGEARDIGNAYLTHAADENQISPFAAYVIKNERYDIAGMTAMKVALKNDLHHNSNRNTDELGVDPATIDGGLTQARVIDTPNIDWKLRKNTVGQSAKKISASEEKASKRLMKHAVKFNKKNPNDTVDVDHVRSYVQTSLSGYLQN